MSRYPLYMFNFKHHRSNISGTIYFNGINISRDLASPEYSIFHLVVLYFSILPRVFREGIYPREIFIYDISREERAGKPYGRPIKFRAFSGGDGVTSVLADTKAGSGYCRYPRSPRLLN